MLHQETRQSTYAPENKKNSSLVRAVNPRGLENLSYSHSPRWRQKGPGECKTGQTLTKENWWKSSLSEGRFQHAIRGRELGLDAEKKEGIHQVAPLPRATPQGAGLSTWQWRPLWQRKQEKVTSPMRRWKAKGVSKCQLPQLCGFPNSFLSSSTHISEVGPPCLGKGRRKEGQQLRISKGIKEIHFLVSASGL